MEINILHTYDTRTFKHVRQVVPHVQKSSTVDESNTDHVFVQYHLYGTPRMFYFTTIGIVHRLVRLAKEEHIQTMNSSPQECIHKQIAYFPNNLVQHLDEGDTIDTLFVFAECQCSIKQNHL